MGKESLILRSAVQAPLTTKAAELTYADFDANIVAIYNEFLALSGSSFIGLYDNAVTYDNVNKNYVVLDGQLWKFVNATPATNVTPGTDISTWVMGYPTDLAHRYNRDQKLDEGGANEVTATELKAITTAYGAGGTTVKTTKVTLNAASIIAGTTAKDLISAVNNKFIDVIDVFIDFNLSVAMDVADTLAIKVSGATELLFSISGLNGKTGHFRWKIPPVIMAGASGTQMLDSTKIVAVFDAINTTATGSIIIYINYTERAI